jgi:hypothetical protein
MAYSTASFELRHANERTNLKSVLGAVYFEALRAQFVENSMWSISLEIQLWGLTFFKAKYDVGSFVRFHPGKLPPQNTFLSLLEL